MAIAHRRGFRTLMSRKNASSYATLNGDDDNEGKAKRKSRLLKAKPLVTVRTAASTDDESSQIHEGESVVSIVGKDKVIVCCKVQQKEEEKVSEEEGAFPVSFMETTRLLAVELVQRSATMTSMVANTLASNSTVNETSSTKEETKEKDDEEKTGDVQQQVEQPKTPQDSNEELNEDSNDITLEQQVGKQLEESFSCGNDLVDSSKESFDFAFQKTNQAANDLIETSTSMGKDLMASTEQSTQAAIIDKLPLAPMLEQTSERLEEAYETAVTDIQEFLTEHWDLFRNKLLRNSIFAKRGSGNIENVHCAEDSVPNVSIEVQMEPSE